MTAPDYLTTREVASLLRLKERKVYDLAAEQQIPCTRATGKLLFPRAEVLRWLQQHSTGSSELHRTALFAGSHDPLLDWAIRESQCGIATLFDGSVDGCQRLCRGEATAAAMHVFDTPTASWNIEHVRQQPDPHSVVLVHFVTRSRGIVFSESARIIEFSDLKSHSVARRQAGAGSQIVLESMLQAHGIEIESLNTPVSARSERDAVLAVVDGSADCTLGLQAVAAQHRLGYLPVIDEPLDLLIDRKFWFEPEMQAFIAFCQSDSFRDKARSLAGYQTDDLFSVLFNSEI
jgi:excisionase family DNA binding protein